MLYFAFCTAAFYWCLQCFGSRSAWWTSATAACRVASRVLDMGIYCAAQLCLTDHSHSRTGVQSYGSNEDSGNRQNKVMRAFSLTVLCVRGSCCLCTWYINRYWVLSPGMRQCAKACNFVFFYRSFKTYFEKTYTLSLELQIRPTAVSLEIY